MSKLLKQLALVVESITDQVVEANEDLAERLSEKIEENVDNEQNQKVLGALVEAQLSVTQSIGEAVRKVREAIGDDEEAEAEF